MAWSLQLILGNKYTTHSQQTQPWLWQHKHLYSSACVALALHDKHDRGQSDTENMALIV